MFSIIDIISQKFASKLEQVGLPLDTPLLIVEASKAEFGDYQLNGMMGAAKKLGRNPRELATQLVALLTGEPVFASLMVAGPGFINITLSNKFIQDNLLSSIQVIVKNQQTVVVDLSAPNLAKEMHVGHLRSTVIGASLAKIYDYLGYDVIKQNHVGDWGTQFGMLCAYMVMGNIDEQATELTDLESFYRDSKIKFDQDPEFAKSARDYVVRLQGGDESVLVLWRRFVEVSLKHCQAVYDKLEVGLDNSNICGESFYNTMLPGVVTQLEEHNLITISNGAKCVFIDPTILAGGEDTPFIVQKSDGGFLYASTDLAAIQYRVNQLHADIILYVVDARQSFHFNQLFYVANAGGFNPRQTKFSHVAFGTMMGEDNKPFKTRSGGTVKLINLLDEAVERAYQIVNERNPMWSETDKQHLAQVMGIGSVKYADLVKNRSSDYVFSFDKMLAFDGNTAPYLLYAYTRINSILEKVTNFGSSSLLLIDAVEEHMLAAHILKFNDKLQSVIKDNTPNLLCNYLYELSSLFMRFYESCPILKAPDVATKNSRLILAHYTQTTLKNGLDLLGINVVVKM